MIFRIYRLLARPSKQGLGALLLPGVAFACVTALLTIVLGGAQTFWLYTDDMAGLYQLFTVMALVMMGIPLISLGAAAAKLSARRRDHRLATLRLLGATSTTTSALAVLEAASIALIGSIVGVLLALAASPLIGLIHFRGEALGTAAVLLPVWAAIAVVLAVVIIATLSAVLSLRRVNISPLGVALKQQAPSLPWLPALIAVVGIILASLVMSNIASLGGLAGMITGIGIALTITLFAIDVIGTWVLGMFARRLAKKAQKPAQMLGARAILESPRAAWRQLSGVAVSSFVAVFAGAGVALLGLAEGSESGTGNDADAFLIADIRTGIIIVVVGTFVMVACTIGVNQAAQILDRADISRSLSVMGAPLELQDSARKQAAIRPLLLASLGSALLAAFMLLPLVGAALLLAPLSLAVVLSSIVFGFVLVLGALQVTKPLLQQVSAA
ncbi:permease [Leucobacter sp. UT-8R-CII-1-4]|uniref:FtsX-like permease family protein n=1 Tax=Leucobacter sp. UT-8R-CII-1-4 TaxID=3040075 RepID=UPI0024A8C0F0|nr:FtsX-like permease family protein [Leucobacter sp. UT-8R-CII-1-4]MDI6024175.1 permease [Leucobacter sp. UT-8R-CII-1-4]